ncbi:MAG: T9SS type A sorting domain-containing protein, partial [Bacteroidota bacterium]|nr:T9SS type A sorting domain-containing protein [Bacteroidota bacterium]
GYGLVDAYAAVRLAQEYKQSDLYVRDVEEDDGTEPSFTNGVMWNSPDIWIEDLAGNVISNPQGNREYKVCVRVHNRSQVSSKGTERLFLNWAKAGVDLMWKENWISENIFDCGVVKGGVIGSANGVLIPSIAPNGNEVVKVTWLTPMSEDYENCTDAGAENWHFCLVARVHDGEEIIGEEENLLNMGAFTEKNNNVAWKNISILNSEFSRAVVSISNPFDNRHNFSLKYKHTPNQNNEVIQDFADVYITLSDGLFKVWQEGGENSQGVKQARGNKFLITDNEVVFDNLILEPNTLHTIETEVNFYTQREPKINSFDFDIIQYCNDCEESLIGGEHYTAIKDGSKDFKAVAIEDKTIMKGNQASFTTNLINEQADYVWYNERGDTLSYEQTLTTIPINSQSYVLEITAKEDGYKDKDTVSVRVKRGIINSITPNPANITCTINYELSEQESNAMITISNIMGVVVYSENLESSQTSKTINLQNLASGQYTLQIISINETLDSKTLIVE